MIIHLYSKSKKKKNKTAKQRQLAAEWEELMKKYPPMKTTKQVKSVQKSAEQPKLSRLPAKFDKGSTAKPEQKTYTGDLIIGIATMHKSNLVPIFNEQAAKDVASMRR